MHFFTVVHQTAAHIPNMMHFDTSLTYWTSVEIMFQMKESLEMIQIPQHHSLIQHGLKQTARYMAIIETFSFMFTANG
jgi:serine protease inhibitor